MGAAALAGSPAHAEQADQTAADPLSLQARVAAVRAVLAVSPEAALWSATQTPNWTNWPKWSKWSNWANK